LHRRALPELIEQIRRLGFGVAIDDLYGNVALDHYFMEFRPDLIKLDRLLVQDCSQHLLKQVLLKNLLCSAHELEIPVLAEGLEQTTDIQFCQAIGVDYGQGFGLARPHSTLNVNPISWLRPPLSRRVSIENQNLGNRFVHLGHRRDIK
jgi:EAL domain-containing protein (putative c-di-GMP-specific phosphodiesterase class I)